MASDAFALFWKEIDEALGNRFGAVALDFNIIGYVALALAGLSGRGTKDVDAIRMGALAEPHHNDVVDFLTLEFGKRSAGELRHGMYLDIVPAEIVWLPPHPGFIKEGALRRINIYRLHPVDVCVSKTFSNFQRRGERGRDRWDILNSLDSQIFAFDEYIHRLDEALPRHEIQAPAPEIYPRVLDFIEELQSLYGPCPLQYSLPNWMENM